MQSSPNSSLSSFRDYYHHTSEYSEEGMTSEEFITKGIKNFKISKVFTRLNWKINQHLYWALFLAFKKIRGPQPSRTKRAGEIVINILRRQRRKEEAIIVKSDCLRELWRNVENQREKELRKIMFFGLKFIKLNYINAAQCYHNVMRALAKKSKGASKDMPPQKKKYLLKLSKAALSILVRNILQKKIFSYFKHLKYTPRNAHPQLAFSKPKKEKVYYPTKESTQSLRLAQALPLLQILIRKHYTSIKPFFIRLLKRKPNITKSMKKDSNIFTHVAKHMIYLTGWSKKQRTKVGKNDDQAIRALKLSLLSKRHRQDRRDVLRQYVVRWRRVVSQEGCLVRREVQRLQAIKKYYMDQI